MGIRLARTRASDFLSLLCTLHLRVLLHAICRHAAAAIRTNNNRGLAVCLCRECVCHQQQQQQQQKPTHTRTRFYAEPHRKNGVAFRCGLHRRCPHAYFVRHPRNVQFPHALLVRSFDYQRGERAFGSAHQYRASVVNSNLIAFATADARRRRRRSVRCRCSRKCTRKQFHYLY